MQCIQKTIDGGVKSISKGRDDQVVARSARCDKTGALQFDKGTQGTAYLQNR